MLVTRFDTVFVAPVRNRAARSRNRSRANTADELEFSDVGRSPRQTIAWVFLASACFWGVVALLILAA
jgi:hypothetical protein